MLGVDAADDVLLGGLAGVSVPSSFQRRVSTCLPSSRNLFCCSSAAVQAVAKEPPLLVRQVDRRDREQLGYSGGMPSRLPEAEDERKKQAGRNGVLNRVNTSPSQGERGPAAFVPLQHTAWPPSLQEQNSGYQIFQFFQRRPEQNKREGRIRIPLQPADLCIYHSGSGS